MKFCVFWYPKSAHYWYLWKNGHKVRFKSLFLWPGTGTGAVFRKKVGTGTVFNFSGSATLLAGGGQYSVSELLDLSEKMLPEKVIREETRKRRLFMKKVVFTSFFAKNFFQGHFLLRKVYIFGFYVKFCVFWYPISAYYFYFWKNRHKVRFKSLF